MDLNSFKELGVAGVGIGSLLYIANQLIRELKESRINYTNFVQDNNHTTTELVREATATMVEVKNSNVEVKNTIITQNELLKLMIDKQK